MKLRTIIETYQGLAQLKNIPDTKIAYAVVKNERILKPLVLDNQPKPTKDMLNYWNELAKAKSNEEKEEINKKHAKTLETIEKTQKEWEEKLDIVELDVELHKITELPANLTAKQVEIIDNF